MTTPFDGSTRTEFDELRSFVGFSEVDSERTGAFVEAVRPHLPGISSRFWQTLRAFRAPQTASERRRASVRASVERWVEEMLSGPHDQIYGERRFAIGQALARDETQQRAVLEATVELCDTLFGLALAQPPPLDADALGRAVARLFCLELAVLLGAVAGRPALFLRRPPPVVFLLDADAKILNATSGAELDFGPWQAGVTHLGELVCPRILAVVRGEGDGDRVRVRGRVHECRSVRPKAYRAVAITMPEGAPARYVVHLHEIDHEPLDEGDDHEVLADLASAIAHELKNPLAGISAAVQLIHGSLGEGDPRSAAMVKVLEQVKRVDGLIEELLFFARPAVPQRTSVELRDAVAEGLARLPAHERSQTRVLGEGLAEADRDMVALAVRNVVKNAWDAGATTVEIHILGPTLRVDDDGPGIPPDRRHAVFQPFYTTRARGTGLGLPNARCAIRATGGQLELATASRLGGASLVMVLEPPTSPS